MNWFELGLNVLMTAALCVLQLFFIGCVTEKHLKPSQFAGYLALLLGVGAISSRLPFDYAGNLLNIIAAYIMSRWGLKNSRPVSCVTAVLAVYANQFSFGLMNSLSAQLFPLAIGHIMWIRAIAVLSTLSSFVLCGGCYWLISKWIPRQSGQSGNYIWLLLPPGLFLFAVELYILTVNYGSIVVVPAPAEFGEHMSLLVLQALGLMVLFSSLYAYRRVCDGFEARSALACLTRETRAQKTYVAEAQARYENTRAFRHDIKSHLSVLDGLLSAGDTQRARSYLKKLDVSMGALSFPVHTGNAVVDILLGNKLTLAKSKGIEIDVSLILPQSSVLTDLDWCVIFANALDNATEACVRAGGVSVIQIAGQRQGDFYMLEFKNTCLSDQAPLTDFGIGLSNIETVAEKYGGAITVCNEQGEFCLNLLLNISRQPNDISIQKA